MLEPNHPGISIRQQCALLDLDRATAYYRKRPENPLNLILRNEIDRQYTATPFYGVPRMTVHLQYAGRRAGPKRVRRLMPDRDISEASPTSRGAE